MTTPTISTTDGTFEQAPDAPLLQVRHLVQEFTVRGHGGTKGGTLQAVADVSFDIGRRETLGLVGETGSGKSTIARSILMAPPPKAGSILLNGTEMKGGSRAQLRDLRRQVRMIYQDPYSSVDPKWQVQEIVEEPLITSSELSRKRRAERVAELLDLVGLDPTQHGPRRAKELSGGQCQRVAIARALAMEPDLIIADEAVSSLDVLIQAQVLNLFEMLRREMDLSYLFVAHDLATVKQVSDRVAVMYLGTICEIGPAERIYHEPLHHYTTALLGSVPRPDPHQRGTVTEGAIAGEPPSPLRPPSGCRFRTRCPAAVQRCAEETPELRHSDSDPAHLVACHFPVEWVSQHEKSIRVHQFETRSSTGTAGANRPAVDGELANRGAGAGEDDTPDEVVREPALVLADDGDGGGMWAQLLLRIRNSPSIRLVVKRILWAIPVLWGVTFLIFCLMNLLPGTAADSLAGAGASQETIRALTLRLDLNQPFWERYWHWLTAALSGNLGDSLQSGQPVASLLVARLPVTVELIILAFILSLGVAIPVAVLAARRPHGIIDRVSSIMAGAGLAMPGFVLGLLLLLAFAVHLKLLPTLGFSPLSKGLWPNLKTMILPAVTLAFGLYAFYIRVLRADLIDQLVGEDYVVTAESKGLTPYRVLVRHVLRNSMFSLLTIVGINIGVLIGGTVLIEQIFDLPGIGQTLIQSITVEDVTMVEGVVVILAIAVVVASLLTDLLYTLLDPRIRHDRPGT